MAPDPYEQFRGHRVGRKSVCAQCGKSLQGEDEPGGRVVVTLQERDGKAIKSLSRTLCAEHAIEIFTDLHADFSRRTPE